MNRFTAIYFPIWYNFFCGFYATIFLQFLLYVNRCVNVGYETYQRTTSGSYITFSSDLLTFTSTGVSGIGLVYVFAIMFGVALATNLFTFIKIITFYWVDHFQESNIHFKIILQKPNSHNNSENSRNIRRNIKLFLQTVLQDVLFFIDNFFAFIMSGLIQHRFWLFICATFVWQTIHVIDGLIMIMFNDRFSLLKRSLFPSQSAPVSMIVESSSWRNQPRRQDIPMVA
ncbi:unnamed protein product [Caenorhabditis nigoni]